MQSSNGLVFGFIRPGKALIGLMVVITTLWLMFAIGLNWGGASPALFFVLTGSSEAILHGQVWRLFTAPLMHEPSGSIGHLLMVVFGLLFLAPRLEQLWGASRTLRFIALTAVLAYAMQLMLELVLPQPLAARMIGPYWYGLGPAISAISIAWACSFQGQTVQLLLLPPMSSRTLIFGVIGLQCLWLAIGAMPAEGMLAPFCGMFLGWALGGGTPSPLRKAWLKLRLAQLEGKEARARGPRKPRPNPGGLRVIPGGRADDDDKGPDGRWLN
jgi:membrane associated rhomboid family serine protease